METGRLPVGERRTRMEASEIVPIPARPNNRAQQQGGPPPLPMPCTSPLDCLLKSSCSAPSNFSL